MNPVLLKGYHGPGNFCDRQVESQSIISAIDNNQDITLFANRRLGKSSLIQHIFHLLKKKYYCVYADLWGTANLKGFTKELANSTVRSELFAKKSFSSKISDFIRSIGASISIGIDGRPSIDVIYHDKNQIFRNLDEIFFFLEQLPKPVILAIDEFQEIKKYEEAPMEAKLRSYMQQSKNIRFIFSGSEKHIIQNMFNEYNQPFYQSTRMMELKKIERKEYDDFVQKQFKKGKKKISPLVISYVLDLTHLHTYYVQAIFNYVYSMVSSPTSIAEFEEAYVDYLLEKKVFYEEFPQRLTKQQFQCVKAIALKGYVPAPTSSDFLSDSGIISSSTMQRVIHSLVEKQIIIKEEKGFRLYDVFLEHYLRLTITGKVSAHA